MEICEKTGAGSVVFRIGDQVEYLVPVIESLLKYSWVEHVGVVQSVNSRLRQVTVFSK